MKVDIDGDVISMIYPCMLHSLASRLDRIGSAGLVIAVVIVLEETFLGKAEVLHAQGLGSAADAGC